MSAHTGISRRQFVGIAGIGGLSLAVGDAAVAAPAAGRPRSGPPDGVVINAATPFASPSRPFDVFEREVRRARSAGWDVLVVPVATTERLEGAAKNLIRLHRYCAMLPDAVGIVRRTDDLLEAHDRGRLAVVAQFQGMQMIELDLDLVPGLGASGVRIMQLTSGWRNLNGDGAFEHSDLRLTALGRRAVTALNDAGVVLDLSAAGRRTSVEAMERSRDPVIFSHSNAAAVHPHPLNLVDEQIDACAATGGVIAISAFPVILADSSTPTVYDIIRHIDHVVDRVGIDHVGLGLDFDDRRVRRFPSDPLPRPPYRYPTELSGLQDLSRFRGLLETAGYGPVELRKILGENIARVMFTVWGDNA